MIKLHFFTLTLPIVILAFPDPWCLDNFTSLLLLEPRLLTIAVYARMNHGFEEEAGTITANVKTVGFCPLFSECRSVVYNNPSLARLSLGKESKRCFARATQGSLQNVKRATE